MSSQHRGHAVVGVAVATFALLGSAMLVSPVAAVRLEPMELAKVTLVSGDRWVKQSEVGKGELLSLKMEDAVSVTDVRFKGQCRRLFVIGMTSSTDPVGSDAPVRIAVASRGKRKSFTPPYDNPVVKLPMKPGGRVRITVTAVDRSNPVPSADRLVSLTFGGQRCH